MYKTIYRVIILLDSGANRSINGLIYEKESVHFLRISHNALRIREAYTAF